MEAKSASAKDSYQRRSQPERLIAVRTNFNAAKKKGFLIDPDFVWLLSTVRCGK
jgi:hypothetical protein